MWLARSISMLMTRRDYSILRHPVALSTCNILRTAMHSLKCSHTSVLTVRGERKQVVYNAYSMLRECVPG